MRRQFIKYELCTDSDQSKLTLMKMSTVCVLTLHAHFQYPWFILLNLPQSFLTNCTAALLFHPFLFWRESSSLPESRRTQSEYLQPDDWLRVRLKAVNVAVVSTAGIQGEWKPQWDDRRRRCSKAQIETDHRLYRLLPQSVACRV